MQPDNLTLPVLSHLWDAILFSWNAPLLYIKLSEFYQYFRIGSDSYLNLQLCSLISLRLFITFLYRSCCESLLFLIVFTWALVIVCHPVSPKQTKKQSPDYFDFPLIHTIYDRYEKFLHQLFRSIFFSEIRPLKSNVRLPLVLTFLCVCLHTETGMSTAQKPIL